jgi:hypothetical protein
MDSETSDGNRARASGGGSGDDRNTVVDALTYLWKIPAGALTAITAAIGLPALSQRPQLVAFMGIVMVLIGLVVVAAILFERRRHQPARRWGVGLGALTLIPFGLFLAGKMPFLPTPQEVSQTLGAASPATASPPPVVAASGRLHLTVEAGTNGDSFAAALRRQIPAAPALRAVREPARPVTVAATASGRWANLASRLYTGRLDVRMRAEGEETVCEFTLTSGGRQTVDVAASQVADQLGTRIAEMMQGDSGC